MLAQQRDSQVSTYSGRATHEELLSAHVLAWKQLLYATPRGGSLLLILNILFLLLPPVMLAPIPNLCPLEHSEYDPPHDRKLATERGT